MWKTPPFRRALTLLFSHRVVFAAVFGAALILGLVVALTPQFLSSASSSALQRELAGRCDSSYNGSLRPRRSFEGFVRFPGVTDENQTALTQAVAGQANLLEPRATIIGRPFGLTPEPGGEEPLLNMTILYRTGWEERVTFIEGGPGGLVIDQYTSEQYGIAVGDIFSYEFQVQLNEDRVKQISGEFVVSGVIEDLVGSRNQHYWCGISDLIGLNPTGDRLSPVGWVALDVFGDGLVPEFEDPPDEFFLRGEHFWELPIELGGLTLGTAYEIVTRFEEIGAEIASTPEAVFSDLEIVSDRVTRVSDALVTSVRPLALGVVVVGLALMGGAGAYWVDRRSDELRLLSAVGAGPLAIGVKATLEMLIPVGLGVGIGALLSLPLSRLVGPGGQVEGAAVRSGLTFAVISAAVAWLLVGAVAALRSRVLLATSGRRRRTRWWTAPLAVGLLASAYLVREAIGEGAVTFGENDLVGSVNPMVILYPLLLFGAVAIVGSELFLFATRRFRGSGGNHSWYLALRRINSSPGPVVVLIAGALIPVAVLVYSAALTRSADVSVQTKGRVFIGSDIRAPVYDFDPLPPELADDSTYVGRAERVDYEGTEVDLLVIDRNTFVQGAFWDDGFSELSLDELVRRLADPAVPLLAAAGNGEVPSEGEIALGRFDLPVRIVETPKSFPGARGSRPILIVERHAFDEYLSELDLPPGIDGTDRYLWTRNGDVEAVEQILNQAEIGFAFTTSLGEALDLTKFQVIIWTFDFLELYAALAGVIVVGAILLYADTRQRHRNLSYALAIRMGLSRRQHLGAGVIEFGGLVFLGGLLGALTAYLAARSLYLALDALPATPPPPRWAGVGDLAVILGVLTLSVGFLAAYVAQRTADNADVSELLRHGG